MSSMCVAKSTFVFFVLAGTLHWSASAGLAQGEKGPAPMLKVGDKAPPLAVEKWLKGAAVPRFEKGKLYVVEFWATWCGPCVASMPDLSALQRSYKDKGLTIIGVNVRQAREYTDGTLKKVEDFVKQQGDRMDYSVAYDGKAGATFDAYMKAAGQNGIPCTFLIDRTGTIAWIGHPQALEGPVQAVVNNNRGVTTGPQQAAPAQSRLAEAYEEMTPAPQEALVAWEELEREYSAVAHEMAGLGFQVLLAAVEYERAYKLAVELVEKAITSHDANALNALARTIVDPRGKVKKEGSRPGARCGCQG
jgi:thiol-disulfide isomerase/thioredoxin